MEEPAARFQTLTAVGPDFTGRVHQDICHSSLFQQFLKWTGADQLTAHIADHRHQRCFVKDHTLAAQRPNHIGWGSIPTLG
jgi:hypothetical protein